MKSVDFQYCTAGIRTNNSTYITLSLSRQNASGKSPTQQNVSDLVGRSTISRKRASSPIGGIITAATILSIMNSYSWDFHMQEVINRKTIDPLTSIAASRVYNNVRMHDDYIEQTRCTCNIKYEMVVCLPARQSC
jgi:hypothetical protein